MNLKEAGKNKAITSQILAKAFENIFKDVRPMSNKNLFDTKKDNNLEEIQKNADISPKTNMESKNNIKNTMVNPLNQLKNENKNIKKIYMDFQSTTPIDPRVLDAMMPYQTTHFGNPHSRTHAYGWITEKAVETARSQVASLINADANEIIFTSGATESTNMALKGLAYWKKQENIIPHFITLQTEHKCVLDSLRTLENDGDAEVTYLPVNSDGRVDLEVLNKSIKENTVCVSVMGINNEIGIVQDLENIGKICEKNKIIFHCDAAQAYGKIPIDVRKMGIGMLSASGHKIYGPKGIGFLFINKKRKRTIENNKSLDINGNEDLNKYQVKDVIRPRIKPLVHGGGQERGLRSGTVPVHLAVGLGKAAEICKAEMVRDYLHVKELSTRLKNYLRKNLSDVIKNGYEEKDKKKKNNNKKIFLNNKDKNHSIMDKKNSDNNENLNNNNDYKNSTSVDDKNNKNSNNIITKKSLDEILTEIKSLKWYPGCLNLSFSYVEGEGLMMALKDIALSSGSACTSASLEPSYALRALGTDEDLAHSSIRFGLGRFSNKNDVKIVGKKVIDAVNKLREMSPLYEMVKEGVDLKNIEWSQ